MSRDAGEFADSLVWQLLGFRLQTWTPGRVTVGWDAPQSVCMSTSSGPVVRGGLVSALLDAANGAACWSVLETGQSFVTADLRVEFLHPCRPGVYTATGAVNKVKRDTVQCAAELRAPDGLVCVTSRCTQVVLADDEDQSGDPYASEPPIVRQ